MKYNIEITETLSRVITVEAPTAEQARERVEQAYNDEEIVLNYNDCVEGAKFEVMDGEVPDDFEANYTVSE